MKKKMLLSLIVSLLILTAGTVVWKYEVNQPDTVPVKESRPSIPGVKVKQITGPLEKQGFHFKTDYDPDDVQRVHYAGQKENHPSRARFLYYMESNTAEQVMRVEYVLNGSNQTKENADSLAKQYFSEAVTLGYEGADPKKAQDWVNQNVAVASSEGQVIQTVIGNVEFELSGTELIRTLVIEPVK